MMGLTRCYKMAFFYILYLLFFDLNSPSIAEILPLPHLENKRTPYGNSTSGFDFELFIVMHRHVILQGRNKLCLNWTITQDGGHTVANLLPVSDLARCDV